MQRAVAQIPKAETLALPVDVRGTPFPWPDVARDVLDCGELDLSSREGVAGDKAQMSYRFETVEVREYDQKPTTDEPVD